MKKMFAKFPRFRKTMRGVSILLLAAMMIAGMTGCSGKQDSKESTSATADTASTASASVSLAAPSAAPTLTPSLEPTPTPSPEPTPTPEPTPEPLPLEGKVIGIDPGHQGAQNNDPEPVSPGSDETKIKVTSGTSGGASGVDEHVVNLAVGLLLRDMLEEQGASVILTRESADVDISNAERAQLFNDYEVNLAIRLHCNGVDDTSVRGAFMLVPESNPYKELCDLAAGIILEKYTDATGLDSLGVTERSDQTGFNWCERPIVNIEMGHMSNAEEDLLLTDADFQYSMAEGLCDGIVTYFEEKDQ